MRVRRISKGTSLAPLAALGSSLLVFVVVLAITPPGPAAALEFLVQNDRNPRSLAVAYAFGAAATFALITLVAIAGIGWLAEMILRRRRRPEIHG